MPFEVVSSTPHRPLEGWKEIAAHLGVQVRTAQRWEKCLGLPVHRIAGQKKPRLIADPNDLDAWLARDGRSEVVEAERQTDRRRILAVAGAAVALGACLLLPFWFFRYVVPDSYSVHGNTLTVYDAEGNDLWRHRFPRPLELPAYSDPAARARFEDIDGDGKLEMLFDYRSGSFRELGTTLFCFSSRGKVNWLFTPRAGVVGRSGREIPSRYMVTQFLPMKRAGKTTGIAVTSGHLWSFPGLLNVLGTDGKVRGEYWHSGHIPYLAAADLNGDGNDEIVVAGGNAGYRQATLLVFDPNRVAGQSDFPEGDQHRMFGRGPGTELAIVRFPRPCFLLRFDESNMVSTLAASAKGLDVWVSEGVEADAPTAMYELDRNLNTTGLALSGTFQARHRELETRGLLDHSITKEEHDRLRQVTVIRR